MACTKVESIKNDETVELLSKSGCKYISISPESGSSEVMKEIQKPFNYNHALKTVKKMNKEGAISGMLGGLLFTASYIIYFKFINPDINSSDFW